MKQCEIRFKIENCNVNNCLRIYVRLIVRYSNILEFTTVLEKLTNKSKNDDFQVFTVLYGFNVNNFCI